MNINSDINVLGSISDLSLIKVFLNESTKSRKNNEHHLSYTNIKTTKSIKRFEKAINNTILKFKNSDIEILFRTLLDNEAISADSLLLLFWNASANNELLHYFVIYKDKT